MQPWFSALSHRQLRVWSRTWRPQLCQGLATYLQDHRKLGTGYQGQVWVTGGHSYLRAGVTYQLVYVIDNWGRYIAFRILGLQATETASG